MGTALTWLGRGASILHSPIFETTAMTLKLRTMALPLGLVVVALLTACGNKGDLYLVPDEVTEQDLIRLEQTLQNNASPSTDEAAAEDDDEDSKKDKNDSGTDTQ